MLRKMLDCPYCSNSTSKVTNKRYSPEGIRRRRECLKCKKRFTTYEKIDKEEIQIIKKDGRKEKFSSIKLSQGIYRALEKRNVAKEKINTAISEIEEQLRRKGKKQIKSEIIGELAIKKIKKLDNIAYIRFASVYKDFQNLNDFNKEISDIK